MTDLSFYEIASENSDKTTYLLKMELLTQSLQYDEDYKHAKYRLIMIAGFLLLEIPLIIILQIYTLITLFLLGWLMGFLLFTLIEFISVTRLRKLFQKHRDYVLSKIGDDKE